MPELPEVETVRRTLQPLVIGRSLVGLTIRDYPGVLGDSGPESEAAQIIGKRVVDVERRGKYLLVIFDDRSGIEIHLGMTGQLVVSPAGAPPLRFERVAIHLDDGSDVRFADQRKFGHLHVTSSDPRERIAGKLGPDPLDSTFDAGTLAFLFSGRRLPIKSALLNQRIVAGIGNIYADEALFRAGIHPLRPAGALSSEELVELHHRLREVLTSAIEHRGTTFSNYRDATGQRGENQARLAVYGRGRRAEPCLVCSEPISFLVIGGRTAHFCPVCQRAGPADASNPAK